MPVELRDPGIVRFATYSEQQEKPMSSCLTRPRSTVKASTMDGHIHAYMGAGRVAMMIPLCSSRLLSSEFQLCMIFFCNANLVKVVTSLNRPLSDRHQVTIPRYPTVIAKAPCFNRRPMYFDLNVPAPQPPLQPGQSHSKKGKGKQNAAPPPVNFAPGQLAALENRIDLLVHCQSATRPFGSFSLSPGSRIHRSGAEPDD